MKRVTPGLLLGSRQGVALVVTLSVTVLLVAGSLEFNRRARNDLIGSADSRDRIGLTEMAAAGIHVAMAILAKDKVDTDTDTPLDDWADPAAVAAVLEEFPFEDGELSLVIEDELGRIQVNALVDYPEGRQFNEAQRSLWERFLQYFVDRGRGLIEFRGDSEPEAILNALKDWLDRGDDEAITGLSGAESAYYLAKKPPYPAGNGPLTDTAELLRVKGITPAIYYGTPELPGISRYLTVHGMAPGEGSGFRFPGRINITTAEPPVIFALLPAENQDLVKLFDEIRREIAAGKQPIDFRQADWLNRIPGLADLKLDPRLITLTSDLFRVQATARQGETATTITAVLERTQAPKTGRWTCRVVSWQVE
ncbi:MAG: hypothetical protein WHT06_06145 [Desulfobacterales bacterium]